MIASSLRPTTVVTIALFFLAVGTFTSVTIQGGYQVLFAFPLIYYFRLAYGRHFRLPTSAWLMLAFATVALLSVLVNWSDMASPGKSLGRIKYFLFAAFGIFPMGAWVKLVSDRTKRWLVAWAVLGMCVAVGWLLWQRFQYRQDAARPLTETMRYAYGTALASLILWAGVLHAGSLKWFPRWWALLGVIAGVTGLLFMNSRGAQAAFILGFPAAVFLRSRPWGMFCGALGLVVIGYVCWNYFFNPRTDSQLIFMNNQVRLLDNKNNLSDSIRRSQWEAAVIAWKERPLLGWGFSNFASQVKRIKEENDLPAKDYFDAHAHNVPLEIAAGTGIVGLLLFLAAFLYWAWECWTEGGLVRALMIPFLLALAFEAQFEVVMDANNATMIGCLYALSFARNKLYQLPFA
jgi:O-antigen ligase